MRKREASALPLLADLTKLPDNERVALETIKKVWPFLRETDKAFISGAANAFAMVSSVAAMEAKNGA